MESPSAMGQGLSNTPQPKPDRDSGPVADHSTSLNRLIPSGMGGGKDETPIPFANRTSNICSCARFFPGAMLVLCLQ